MRDRSELVARVLCDQRVLAVTHVVGLGSLFELGEWVPRDRPVPNPSLPSKQQTFKGSRSLYVQCQWTLDSPVDLVPEGTRFQGELHRMTLLENLVSRRIVETIHSPQGLTLRMDDDFALELHLDGGTCAISDGETYWNLTADSLEAASTRLASPGEGVKAGHGKNESRQAK